MGFRTSEAITVRSTPKAHQLYLVTALLLILLFCSPPIETLYELGAPQPLVLLFELALGPGGQLFVSIISIIGLLVVSDGATTTSSPT